MLVASMPAWADPGSTSLQIRLTVVEGCSSDAGNTRCAAAHRSSDAPELPQQIRDLAPPADSADAAPAVTLIY
ncbi:TPA: hypothetical protein ACXJLS_000969 [Stenotrophomonas maltophilia]